MVGILKAMGAPDPSIQQIFLYHGSYIALTGMLFGNGIGLLICWLQYHYGFITLPEDTYFISKAVVKLEWWHLVLVNAGTFIVCFLVLLIPHPDHPQDPAGQGHTISLTPMARR